jgi:hypothetical protein
MVNLPVEDHHYASISLPQLRSPEPGVG